MNFARRIAWLAAWALGNAACGVEAGGTDAPKASPAPAEPAAPFSRWTQKGFAEFRQGTFEDAGADLYVSAAGVVQRIHQHDLNRDGAVDLLFCNTHDVNDSAETYAYLGGKDGFQPNRRMEFPRSGVQAARIADLNADGRPDLVLASYYDGATYALDSHLYFGAGSGLDLSRRISLPTLAAKDAVVADFDHDGQLDVFFVVPWRDAHFEAVELDGIFYRGQSGKLIRSPLPGVLCHGSVAAEARDLNGDGYVDLILANERKGRDPKTMSFIYWNSPRGFSVAERTELPTEHATGISLGDADGDGRPDMAFANKEGGRTPLYLNGPAGFSAQRVIWLPQSSTGVALCDFDRDGAVDAVLVNGNAVYGYTNRNGDFGPGPAWTLPAHNVSAITAADLDGDGFPELIVSNQFADQRYGCDSFIYWGSNAGYSTQRRTDLPTFGAGRSTVGDLNGDGYCDVVFTNTAKGHVPNTPLDSYVYWGDENGRFSPRLRTGLTAVEAYAAATADLDGNGYPEVILAGIGRRDAGVASGASLIYANGPAGFAARPMDLPLLGTLGVGVADFNRDGYLDVLFSNGLPLSEPDFPGASSVIFWGGPAGFDPKNFHSFPTPQSSRFTLADFDRDGFLDLAIAQSFLKRISVYWGNAQGRFSEDARTELPASLCTGTNAADLDGDGYLDLVACNKGSVVNAAEPAIIYWGGPCHDAATRTGVLSTERRTDLPSSAGSRACIADFNKDGRLDICITNYLGSENRAVPSYIYWGDGRRFASLHRTEIPIEAGSGALCADFNRDGWPDLAVVSHKAGPDHTTVSKVFWGHEHGFLHRQVTELPTIGAHQLQLRDIGHAADRGPGVGYRSVAHRYETPPLALTWRGETPGRTALAFHVRSASSEEGLASAAWSKPQTTASVDLLALGLTPRGWIQYRVEFISPDAGLSPLLSEVSISFQKK